MFKRETLQALRDLTDAGWTVPRSIRVDSITNFQHSAADGDDLVVNDLVPDPAQLSDADIAALQTAALAEPALVGGLLSKRAHVSSVNVRLEMPGDSREATAANKEVMEAARRLRDDFETRPPDLDIHLMGQVVVNHAFNEISEADAAKLVPLMFAVVIVLIGLFLRSLWGVATTSLVILYSIIATVGALGRLGYQINQINVSGRRDRACR